MLMLTLRITRSQVARSCPLFEIFLFRLWLVPVEVQQAERQAEGGLVLALVKLKTHNLHRLVSSPDRSLSS